MNKKISFIAGCFDSLHNGHLYILKEASKLGQLIVAINSDEYLAKKGAGRPIDKQNMRVAKLYDTGLVENVILFESNPLELIMKVKPDFIVVGDDYTEDRVVGAKESKEWGGQVVIIPRIEGYSTTSIIENKR